MAMIQVFEAYMRRTTVLACLALKLYNLVYVADAGDTLSQTISFTFTFENVQLPTVGVQAVFQNRR